MNVQNLILYQIVPLFVVIFIFDLKCPHRVPSSTPKHTCTSTLRGMGWGGGVEDKGITDGSP